MSNRPVKPGDHVELSLTDLSYLGGAVGRTDGNLAVFASGGLPGERAVIEIDEVRRRFARGHVVEVREASPERVAPPCPYFGACGGCQWQHLAYPAQVRWKTELVRRQLQRVGHLVDPPVRPMIGAAHPWNYRNQGRFSVDAHGHLCFTRFHSRQLLPIDACLIMQPAVVQAMSRLQGVAPGVHQVVVRYGTRTGQFLIAPWLPDAPGDLPSGQEFYEEILLGRRYRVSAPSFFQVNTRVDTRELPLSIEAPWIAERSGSYSQADLLALLVLDRLRLTGREFVVDAYCGVGTFALLAAERAGRVVGIEEARCAVLDGEYNAVGMENVQFRVGRTEDVLGKIEGRPDAVVLDPSRLGCAPGVLRILGEMRPRTIVYVSCDPATLARDLEVLCASGFTLDEVQPIDMFPQTHHIETVSVLQADES
jgi:23S rRNA (uracil1939-C5)-methyltransferase